MANMRSKIDAALADGDVYLGLQLYRSVANRLFNRRRFAECRALLAEASRALAAAAAAAASADPNCCADLCRSYAECVAADGGAFADDEVRALLDGIRGCCDDADADDESLAEFAALMLNGSQAAAGGEDDDDAASTRLHDLFAREYEQRRRRSRGDKVVDDVTVYHLVRGGSADACADYMIRAHVAAAAPAECGIFICQTVLRILAIRRTRFARDCLGAYALRHPQLAAGSSSSSSSSREDTTSQRPLLNFLALTIAAVERRDLGSFVRLCDTYAAVPPLSLDPTIHALTATIRRNCFLLDTAAAAAAADSSNERIVSHISSLLGAFSGVAGAAAAAAAADDDDLD